MIRSGVLITLIPSTISFKILNKNGLPTTLSRYFKEKTKKFPKIFGDFKKTFYLCTLVIKEISGLTGFDGEIDRDEAIRQIQSHSREYMRKQLTWFKRDAEIHWYHPNQQDEIIRFIDEEI